jgi:hypothetical protein
MLKRIHADNRRHEGMVPNLVLVLRNTLRALLSLKGQAYRKYIYRLLNHLCYHFDVLPG